MALFQRSIMQCRRHRRAKLRGHGLFPFGLQRDDWELCFSVEIMGLAGGWRRSRTRTGHGICEQMCG